MNLVVDRIVDEVVVCQSLETKMKFEIDIKSFDFELHDGDVISFIDGKYVLNPELKKQRIEIIKDKINKAKNN